LSQINEGRCFMVKNRIDRYMHCVNCMKKKPEEVSPKEWSRTQLGKTPYGFQLWCNRCEMNVWAWESEDDIDEQRWDWNKENTIVTPPSDGKETYFRIKEQEKDFKDSVYVWFTNHLQVENMWVRIQSGNQKEGSGALGNAPSILTNYKLGELIHYRTDKDGVTRVKE
jgi:hypothetical protein